MSRNYIFFYIRAKLKHGYRRQTTLRLILCKSILNISLQQPPLRKRADKYYFQKLKLNVQIFKWLLESFECGTLAA